MTRPYVPHAPRFPLPRDKVVAACLAGKLPLQVAGEALALMDLMEREDSMLPETLSRSR